MKIEQKEELEKYAQFNLLNTDLTYYAKNKKQIEKLTKLQDDCKYSYSVKYALIKKEGTNEITRERKQAIKAINTLRSYINTKYDDPVLNYLIESIDQKLDLNNRISAAGYIEKMKAEILQELSSVSFSKTDITKHLSPVLIKYIKEPYLNQ